MFSPFGLAIPDAAVAHLSVSPAVGEQPGRRVENFFPPPWTVRTYQPSD